MKRNNESKGYPINNLPPHIQKKHDEYIARQIKKCEKTMANIEPTYNKTNFRTTM